MKLRLKLFTLLTVSYLLIFIVLQLASNTVLLRGIEELENNEIKEETSRGLSSLTRKIDEIEEATSRFSTYTYTYKYLKSHQLLSQEYILGIFNDVALSEADVNYVLLFDLSGEAILEKGFDLISNVEKPVPEELIEFFEMNSILVVHQNPQSNLTGLLKTPVGLCVMSSQPVSASKGTTVGTIVMCREIDSFLIDTIEEDSSLSVNLIQILDTQDRFKYEGILDELQDSSITIQKFDEDTVTGYAVMNDLYGAPVLLFKVDSERLIHQQGILMVNYFVLSFVLIGVSIGMLVLLALNRMVVMPLSKLSGEVADIDPATIGEVSVEMPGEDEIASLSTDIEKMLDTLRDYQAKIKDTERMVSIGATATMVGHDLRNPLQVVFMLSELIQNRVNKLEETTPSESELRDLKRLTSRIRDQAAYMNKIVSDLQGLTKGVTLEIEDVDLEELIYEIIESVQVPDKINKQVIFDEDFPDIYADNAKLRRVFTNLITNAVQSMTTGGELTVTGHREGKHVYVSVGDTGCGIAKENIDRIFDPLFTTKAKGTGLGLTVCKRVIDAHGGKILLKSHIDVGSRFTVMLPIVHDKEENYPVQDVYIEYAMPQAPILPNCL